MDARIAVGLPAHPKTKKLIRWLGQDAAWKLVCLFLWVSANRPDGDLSGLSDEDIELSVDWEREEGLFVEALKIVGFLDGTDGNYRIHDWAEHNPWAASSEARSEQSKWAALCKRHGKARAAELMPDYAERSGGRAGRTPAAVPNSAQCARSAQDCARTSSADSAQCAPTRSAPFPSPSPSPKDGEGDKPPPPPLGAVSAPTGGANAPAALPEAEPQPSPGANGAAKPWPCAVDPPATRKGAVCRLLREAGVADAAPHVLPDETWEAILAKRTDEEIVGFAAAKLADRRGQRTGLRYLAPGLLEEPRAPPKPQPTMIAGLPPGTKFAN